MNKVKKMIAALAVAGTALTVAQLPASAGGYRTFNAKVCGTHWVDVHYPKNSYYNFYNDNFGNKTCINVMRHRLDFQISYVGSRTGFFADPNISSGYESGRSTCTGHSGACFRYPVQVKHDGDPKTSVAAWLAPGVYDFNYDIWTNRTDAHPVQNNGTEVMIWLAHPGVREGITRSTVIDGVQWDVTTWICHRNGATWRLLIYYAVHPRSSIFGMHINDFFHEAERHGDMSASYYLTGITSGFELVRGGLHDNIHYYKLSGVN